MRVRREKNLYYNCDETFIVGHRCKNRQIFLMLTEEEELAYNQDPCSEEDTSEEVLLDDMTMLLNALSGNTNMNALRIRGTVNNKEVQILIDSGSTHCFLDEDTALQLGCTLEATIPMMMSVADGSKMVSRTISPYFTWTLQGHRFSYPIRIIKLGGCDMVLSGDWLRRNSPVEFDYHKMKVTISRNGRKAIMKAMTDTEHLKMIYAKGLNKLIKKIAISMSVPTWIREVQDSYTNDKHYRDVIQEISVDKEAFPEFKTLAIQPSDYPISFQPSDQLRRLNSKRRRFINVLAA
ncbi:hypothetical protein BUALT_Bualt01G0215700 [Buddleja alternifolia]|uniref:Uncharacterized protein n=1 Tax=Buddleja alternifolia TaxID=168488 RepID=A0AAV6YHH9_9LAMI|nr:hypothetical protein BUALT_Bualt01G0215700 [Buddleja alternifolia]